MPLLIPVPDAVVRNAQRALAIDVPPAVGEVQGQAVAQQLATGFAQPDLIPRLHAFFTSTEAAVALEQDSLLQTEDTSGLLRSRALHGGEQAVKWAGDQYRKLVGQGAIDPDPVAQLFEHPPEEVYDLFSAGAFRYEYGLDTPGKCARFVENYARGTGRALHLERAFGRASPSVTNALLRRIGAYDPWTSVYRAYKVEDQPHRLAADQDLRALSAVYDGPLGEGLNQSFFKGTYNAGVVGKNLFPVLLAYFILAIEDPESLKPNNQDAKPMPAIGSPIGSYAAYNDVQNTVLAYFHPNGKLFHDPDQDEKFAGVDVDVMSLYNQARHGFKVNKTRAIKTLGRARQWLVKNKQATGALSILVSAWRKGDWQTLLDAIPADSDIRPYFTNFEQKNIQPEGGAQLQQTQNLPVDAKDYLTAAYGSYDKASSVTPEAMDSTAFGKACAAAGTPVGINSVLTDGHFQFVVIGAYTNPGNDTQILLREEPGGKISASLDGFLASKIQNGSLKVQQGHKDMPGTAYSNDPQPKPDTAPAVPPQHPPGDTVSTATPDWDEELVKAAAIGEVGKVVDIPNPLVFASSKFAKKTFQTPILLGTLLSTDTLPKATVVGTFKDAESEYLYVLRNEADKSLLVVYDDVVVDGLKKGLMWLTAIGPKLEKKELYASAKEYFLDQNSDTAHQFKPMKLDLTTSSFALDEKYGVELQVGTQLKQGENVFTFEAAFFNPYLEETWLVYKVPGNKYNDVKDEVLRDAIKAGKVVLAGATDPKSIVAVAQSGETPPPAVELPKKSVKVDVPQSLPSTPGAYPKPQPKFTQGDILNLPGEAEKYQVVAIDFTNNQYLLNWLAPTTDTQNPCQPVPFSKVDATATLHGQYKYSFFIQNIADLVYAGDGFKEVEQPDHWPVKTGDLVEFGNTSYKFVKAVTTFNTAGEYGETVYPLLARTKTVKFAGVNYGYFAFSYGPANLWPEPAAAEPEPYAPQDPEPVAGEEDAVAAQQASDTVSPEPKATLAADGQVGSQEALDFMKLKGWSPSTKPAGAAWDLGDVLTYGIGSRWIIGFAYDKHGNPYYITATEKGNVSYKGVDAGNKSYGPVKYHAPAKWLTAKDAVDQGFSIDLPAPLQPEPKFPKLNYALSDEAKAYAKETGLIFEPEQKGQPYHANTTLTTGVTGAKFKLLGFTQDKVDGKYKAVIQNKQNKSVAMIDATLVGSYYSVQYKYGNYIGEDDGEIVFGKQLNAPEVSLNGTIQLPSDLPSGWNQPKPIKQPPLQHPSGSKHVSAGVVCLVPSGLAIFVKGQKKPVYTSLSVVMTHPMNEYGGYVLTYPKGTVEPGEPVEKAAVREVWEETGLSCVPVAHLGDFVSDGSVTRMFIGQPTGGNPKKAGKETDAVTIKPLGDIAADATAHKAQPWYQAITPRDKEITDAAVAWYLEKGYPGLANLQDAAAYSQVTPAPPEPAATPKGKPIANIGPHVPLKMLAGKVDYVVSNDDMSAIGQQVLGMGAGVANWKLTPQVKAVALGYPAVGSKFQLEGDSENAAEVRTAVAYYVKYWTSALMAKGQVVFVYRKDSTGKLYHSSILQINKDSTTTNLGHPENFIPAPADPDAPQESEPASSTDIWGDLLANANFPISQKVLDAVQQYVDAAFPANPESVGTMTDGEAPAPSTGQVFTLQPGGANFTCLGYVSFAWFNPVQEYTIIVGQSSFGEVHIWQFDKPSNFPVNETLTEASKNPQAFYTHPIANSNKLLIELAGTPDAQMSPSGIGKWVAEAGFPHAEQLTTSDLIFKSLKFFVPGAASGTEHQAFVDWLALKAEQAGATAPQPSDTVSPVSGQPFATPTNGQYTFVVTVDPDLDAWNALTVSQKDSLAKFTKNYPSGLLVKNSSADSQKALEYAAGYGGLDDKLATPGILHAEPYGETSPATAGKPAGPINIGLNDNDTLYIVTTGSTAKSSPTFKKAYPNGLLVWASSTWAAVDKAMAKAGVPEADTKYLFPAEYTQPVEPDVSKYKPAGPIGDGPKLYIATAKPAGSMADANAMLKDEWKSFKEEYPYGLLVKSDSPIAAKTKAVSHVAVYTDVLDVGEYGVKQKGPLTAATATPEQKAAFVAKMQEGYKKKKQLVAEGKLPPEALKPKKKNVIKAPASAPVIPPKPVGDQYIAAVDNPQPEQFTQVKQISASGANNYYYEYAGPAGTKWFAKAPKDGNPARAHASAAAYKMMAALGLTSALPTAVLTKGGQVLSIQPLVEDKEAMPANPATDAMKAAVLRQHAADMFFGDHDGHAGNWFKKGDKLIPIDREQAFKFYVYNVPMSLDPEWHPAGNVGEPVAKRLLKRWGDEQEEIPDQAFGGMRGVIKAVQKLTDAQITAWLKPYFNVADNGSALSAAKANTVLKKIFKARDDYLDDWTAVLKKLRPTFEWPGATLIPGLPIDLSPADLNFGEREDTLIADAKASGWQGKSLSIDGPALENQEVMVREVQYNGKIAPQHSRATLIHFRVNAKSAKQAEAKLKVGAKVIAAKDIGGPQLLHFDSNAEGQKYYGVLLSGIKTVNAHITSQQGFDGVPNKATIAKVQAVHDELKTILSTVKAAKAPYQGVDAAVVQNWAEKYVEYAETILDFNAKAPELAKQNKAAEANAETPTKTEQITPFLYEPPKKGVKQEEEKTSEFVKVEMTLKAGYSPPTTASFDPSTGKAQVLVNEQHAAAPDEPIYLSSYIASQFRITVPSVPGARLYYLPSDNSSVLSYPGQAWGIIPGEATTEQVAILLKAFEEATGLPMKASSPIDEECLYLSKQCALLQSGGSGHSPTSSGEAATDPPYVQALGLFQAGQKEQARTALRALLAKYLSAATVGGVKKAVTPDDLDSLPNYGKSEYTRHTYKNGTVHEAGWRRTPRIGWTREKLVSYFGHEVYFIHHITQGSMASFIDMVTKQNGCLMANAVRRYYGVPNSGASVSSDTTRGGSVGIFGGMRGKTNAGANHLYFDTSIFLRPDVFVIGSGDSFGDVTVTRYLTPESWKANDLHNKTGGIGISSSYQMCARHDIDLRQYLHTAVCPSVADKQKCLKLVKQYWGDGVLFAQGRTPEQVFTVKGEE